ncbi:MAG: hypothetical protein LQ341_004014 [Variospora aurantia]|nr:MAG: hypothetical protein LQ341_004014 [Variospora aurantia]
MIYNPLRRNPLLLYQLALCFSQRSSIHDVFEPAERIHLEGFSMAQIPPFGVILPSRPVITNPATVSPTQYAFTLPSSPSFSHVVVFLVPGTPLPADTLAAVYIQLPGDCSIIPDFKLLGAIGNDKQTAIFRVKNNNPTTTAAASSSAHANNNNHTEEEDEMTDATLAMDGAASSADPSQPVTIGISIEPASTISAQLAALQQPPSSSSSSSALVLANRNLSSSPVVPTKVLAQRIIKNAFNFLASFAGQTTVGGEEMVPLRSFRGWWEKFERRVENDPGFLEREADG